MPSKAHNIDLSSARLIATTVIELDGDGRIKSEHVIPGDTSEDGGSISEQ